MLKKFMLGTFFVGLIAILIIGAVNRTSARSESESAEEHSTTSNEVLIDPGTGNQGQGTGNQGEGTGGRGQDDGNQGYGRSADVSDPVVADWVTVSGTVTGVSAEEVTVETAAGQQVAVGGRPWSYAQEQQFKLRAGDQVVLRGFYEGEELEVGTIENRQTGATIQVRDETGRPMWAGRGRRAQAVSPGTDQ